MRSFSLRRNLVIFSVLLASSSLSAQNVSRQLVITPTSVNFGTVAVGTNISVKLIITNTGNKGTNLRLPPTITGTGFSCSGLPTSLAPGQSFAFKVTLTPATLGTVNGSLSVSDTGSNLPATAALTGTAGYGKLVPNPTSLSFGMVTLGTSSILPVVVTNTGTASTTISQYSAKGTGFTVSGPKLPLSLAPGQSTSISVTFAPTSIGTATGSASLVSNASNSPTTDSLAGNGVAATGQLATNPTTLSFGTVTVGTSSSMPLAVSNTGTGSISISQASVTGSEFALSGLTLPLTLSPGAGTSFNVIFAPTTTGAVSGAVSLVSSASNSPTSVSLAATGANQHYVSLSWTDTSSVAGYNVYRGSKSGGPYTRINPSLDAVKAYTAVLFLRAKFITT